MRQESRESRTCFAEKNDTQYQEEYVSDSKATAFNFVSIVTNIILIILTFTGILCVTMGTSYYSKQFDISLFSFFDCHDFVSMFNVISSELEDFEALMILGDYPFYLQA